MSKLRYEALSRIPKRFIDKFTTDVIWSWEDKEAIFLANPKFAPMVYSKKNRQWEYIKLERMPKNYLKKLVLRPNLFTSSITMGGPFPIFKKP